MNARAARLAHAPRRWPYAVAAALLALVGAVAIGEWLGWPFLAAPVQRWMSERLERRVVLSDGGGIDTYPGVVHDDAFRVRFVGGLRLHATQFEIAAPAWSTAPHLLLARDVDLELGYADLWRAWHGQRLKVRLLQARTLDTYLERLADGRASWQFRPPPDAAPAAPLVLPQWGSLQVGSGLVHYRDAPLAIDVLARLALEGDTSPATASAAATVGRRLQVNATGQVRKLPVKIDGVAYGVLPWASGDTPTEPVPVTLDATVGRAHLAFKGTATDALHLSGMTGRFSLKGPSLAAVGDALGVTLPTTAAFRMDGLISKQGDTWRALINDADIGASRLNGAFVFEAGRSPALLSGRLGGARLALVDLGPVVGTTAAVPAAGAGSAPAAAPPRSLGKVLPNRPFDLPALRAMDANVLIDVASVDLNTSYLEPLQPLRGHLVLTGGLLTLRNLDARTAQGQLTGDLALDGRDAKALWTADLRWDGVRLERWIRQTRANAAPPFVSGRLNGRASVAGQGRSTADILASLKGQVRTELRGGSVSHLLIEAAGLDIAQSLGVMIKGDDALPVTCAVADLAADSGVLRTRVMVLDTTDSTVWIDGSLSLAAETLDLRAVVSPKDRSPLTLRTPLRVHGSFADPQVSLEKGAIGTKLAASFLLALVNPLAALLPLIDLGSAEEAGRSAASCQALVQRKPAALQPATAAR